MRYEKKFPINAHNEVKFLNWLNNNKFLFYKQFPPRYVNSLYFDDINNSSLIENIEGYSNKIKFRIRWYDDLNSAEIINLELKIKKDKYVYKENYNIKKNINFKDYNYSNLQKMIYDKSSNKFKFFLNKYNIPIGISRYYRKYFASRIHKDLRLTYDSNLCFFKKSSNKRINLQSKSYTLQSKIVELKYNDQHLDKNISFVLENFPVSGQKFSKYYYLNKFFL